ncbi:hypothetical protein O6H91_06G056500 [Diphasiastrum complanatum]|uniref:Uncharacterized protein n=1 Tax=Diphasiastrum complanatum TaxID=34168 RepID=A0ACC2DDZ3_DIPCM|nr:hypothetical protein O6H91_06G056500 [Diphasiastrum complanatum]
MANYFQSFEVSDISLGKPPLHWITSSTTIDEAFRMLKELNLTEISVWDCPATPGNIAISAQEQENAVSLSKFQVDDVVGKDIHGCQCVGRVNMIDIICHLAREDCLQVPNAAFLDPVSVLLPPNLTKLVRHVDSHERLCNALYLMLEGAQYLVVPIEPRNGKSHATPQGFKKLCEPKAKSNSATDLGLEEHRHGTYCWLTQEDVLRFMLGHFGIFSPQPNESIENLGIINTNVMCVQAHSKAISTLPLLYRIKQSVAAVAVVEDDPTPNPVDDTTLGSKLVGDISLSTLKNCTKFAGFALASLSVREFLSYCQSGELPSKALRNLVNLRFSCTNQSARMKVRTSSQIITEVPNAGLNLPDPDPCTSPYTSDVDVWEDSSRDESTSSYSDESFEKPFFSAKESLRWSISRGHMLPITCRPWSSLIAVMAQALAHRSSFVWVTDDEKRLVGIVTYCDILTVLLNHLN